MHSMAYLNSGHIQKSYATCFPLSRGHRKDRLILNGSNDHKTRINVQVHLASFIELIDRVLNKLGFERKWIKVKIQNITNNKFEYVLLNVNSLCKRTLINRSDVFSKNLDELSQIIAQPENLVFQHTKLKNLFPHVLLINLDDKKDRITNLNQHLRDIGQADFTYDRIPAVVGKNLPWREIFRMSKSGNAQRNGRDDRAGRLGCFLSHLAALKEAKARGYPHVLICEDDVRFMPHYLAGNDLQKALSELPKDWGVLFLGYFEVDKKNIKPFSDHLIQPGSPYDMHAYCVNASMYDEFIEKFESELKKDIGTMRACDVVVAEELPQTGRVYALKENVAIQDEGLSSIVNQHVQGNYSRELSKLKQKMPSLKVVQDRTADLLPVVHPLTAGAIYQMMQQLDEVFKKHGIKYWIEGESALGAVRNGGLIPTSDAGSFGIFPGDEEILNTEDFKNDLAKVGMQITPHWRGHKIFLRMNHPKGKELCSNEFEGVWRFKTPSIDISHMKVVNVKNEASNGFKYNTPDEEILVYKSDNARRMQKDYYVRYNEFQNSSGLRNRADFGPVKLDTLWNPIEYCQRIYGSNCMEETYAEQKGWTMQKMKKIPIRLTDFRQPAYQEWEGLPPLSN